MHKYKYILDKKSGHVFADNRYIAQMKAAQALEMPAFLYERVTVRLVEKNAGQVTA